MKSLIVRTILFLGVLSIGVPLSVFGAYVKLSQSDDTYIRDFAPFDTYNYGSAASMECGNDKVGGKFHKSRFLVTFPYVIDSIPDGATIDSAKLHLNCSAANLADTARAFRVLQNWGEGASDGAAEANMASWNQWGAGTDWGALGGNLAVPDGDPAYADSSWDRVYNDEDAVYIGATGDLVWHVAAAVQAWADNEYLSFGWKNYGLLFKMDTEAGDGSMNEFASEEQADATSPYLDVWYSIIPPVITGLDDAVTAYANQYDSNLTRFGFEVDDPNDDTVRVYMELERIGQGYISWDSLNGYVAVDGDTGWIDTSATMNDTLALNFRVMWGTSVETVCVSRLIVKDIRTNADTVYSDTFIVDTKDPSGLTALTISDSSGGAVTLNWSVVTETNFDHYEIRYNTSSGISLATTDIWDDSDDAVLATRTTTTTIITGLNSGTDYYFKIWAVDTKGNYETVAERQVHLTAAPVVGWDDNGCVFALAPSAWSSGNGITHQSSGEFPGYPDGGYNVLLTNMSAGYGYVYAADSGHFNFDGSDDKIVTTGLTPLFSNESKQTFEVKIVFHSSGNGETYLSQWDDANNYMYCVKRTDDRVQLLFMIGGVIRRVIGNTVLTDNTIYTLHFIKDGATLKMYYNGVEESSYLFQETYDLGTKTFTQSMRIGYFDRGGADLPLMGKMGWVALYTTALSQKRITANAYADHRMSGRAIASGDVMAFESVLAAQQYDANFVRVFYNATDEDDDSVVVTVEGKIAQAGSWTTWGGGFNNFAEWDTGSVATLPTSRDSIRWKMKSMLGTGQDTVYLLRVIATAPDGSADSTFSDTFKIDTKNPLGLATFAPIGSTATTCTFAWDPTSLVETNFHHYEIWYGKVLAEVSGRSGSAREWDYIDDADLSIATADSTIITGLDVGTKYYFRMWAADSFGNEQVMPLDSMYTEASPVPVLKGVGGTSFLYSEQIDTSTIHIIYQVEDSDDATVIMVAELKESDAGGWADWDSLNGYIKGDTGTVTAAAGVNDTMVLDLRTMWGDQVDTTIIIRVIADDLDGVTANDTLYADTIVIDTKDPVGLGASGLSITVADTYSVTLNWSAISEEKNFDHYEIWYDTLAGITRGAGEHEWDEDDDVHLATMVTTSTEITGLLQKHHYYFKMWAVDSLGNDSTVVGVDTTTVNVAPEVTGWSDEVNVGAKQIDSSIIRIQYEMDDFDDAQCMVQIEGKLWGEAGWTGWGVMKGFASGDTGMIDTASSTGRVAFLDIRALLGSNYDTLGLVRIIVVDASNYADTAMSDTFVLDTKDPVGLANFVLKDSTLTTVNAVWDAVTGEKNFDHYEIWYSTNKTEAINRSGVAQEWDAADADTLAYRSADSSMVTGLTYNTLFYFRIFVYDSLGNYAALPVDSLLTPTTAQASLNNTEVAYIQTNDGPLNPNETEYNYGASATFATGYENGGANDPNYRGFIRTSDLSLMPSGATLDSAKLNIYCTLYSGTPDSLRIYRVIQNWIEGTSDGATGSGVVTWNEYGGGASWYTIGCDFTIANASATDGGDADRAVDPEDVQPLAAQDTWITFDVFSAFQLWIDGYHGLDFGWDNNGVLIKQDDETTMNNNNAFSSDDGTNPPYFEVWYRVVPPVITGWDDAVDVNIEQYDTSAIRVGYEMLDGNDGSTYVTIELHEVGKAWVLWDSIDAYASGDTGWVDTSATLNDTALINIRELLGSVDSLYELRVIARDKRMNVDTLYSQTFELDTKDPTSMVALSASDSTRTTITLNWTATIESDFAEYRIYYDTIPGITEVDSLWDSGDDAALTVRVTNTTTITGLISNKEYYFKIWASDGQGNETATGPESCWTLIGPVLSGIDDAIFISSIQYDSSFVRIGYEVDDENEDSVHISVQYKKSSDGAWSALTGITGDTGWVDTSVVANDTILWDARGLLGVIDTCYLVRVIARDKDSLFDTLATDTFYIDTQDPQNLVNFHPTQEDTFAITLGWDTPVESHFERYEIRYDSVAGITIDDSLWGVTDEAALGTLATGNGTVAGLARRTTYYFRLWAFDSLGNVTASQETSAATANIAPTLTGWDDAFYADAKQIDSSYIRLGYELDDYDDAQDSIFIEIKMKDGTWADWDSVHTYCTGDTGVLLASATAHDTVLLDIRRMWGSAIDTLCLVQILARDARGAYDTLLSDTFVVDTKDPVGLSKMYPVTSDTYNVSVRWDTVTTENNFDRYYVYYSAGAGVDRGDSLWDMSNDVRLDTVGTETTTVTGLAGKKRYYFRLYAEDSLGNVASSAETSYATANVAPQATGWADAMVANALQFSTANVRLGYEADDFDDAQVTVSLEGKKPSDASWTPWSTMRNFVYQDTGTVATSATAHDTALWKMKTQFGPGIDTLYVIKIILTDTSGAKDSVLTDTFVIDTKRPVGMDNLVGIDSSEVTVTMLWDTVTTENNFDHYELWYGTVLAEVLSRGGGATEWDGNDDIRLDTVGIDSTIINGLTISTKYYVKIWAVDQFGNDTTITLDSISTLPSNTPVVRGWSGAPLVRAGMSDSSVVQIGYQVDDSDDGAVIITYEMKRPGEVGWVSFDSLDAYTVAGSDTGNITTSAMVNDTIGMDARTLWGDQIDTVYIVRVIGADDALPTHNRDTTLSDTFVVDTKDPIWVGASFEPVGHDTFNISLQWSGIPTETNFGHYEVWYDTLPGITRTVGEQEWDESDDATLSNKATTTTIITGLQAKRTYYFKIWAQDSLGNEAALNETLYTTASIAPEVTGWVDEVNVYAVQIDSSNMHIGYELDDYDDATATVLVEMQMVGGSWMDWDSLHTYATGDTGVIGTSATAHDTINFSARTVWGAGLDTLFLARVIALDSSAEVDTAISDTFVVDTKDPVWAGQSLQPAGSDTFSISLQWTGTPTETNFGHYEIWYDTLAGITRGVDEQEWDNDNDVGLVTKATSTTSITGLLAKRTYYFKIWVVDSLGNETTLNETLYATADIAPELTGWNDEASLNARQIDSSYIRLGYELNDYDDATDTITVEMQMVGGSWMDWDSLDTFAAGDTGVIGISSSANDTVHIAARTVWGASLDTLFLARIIAKDTTGLTDTVTSDTFAVDTRDPNWSGGALAVIDSSGDRVTIAWDTVTAEHNFLKYEIWYDTSKTNTVGKIGTAQKYDVYDNAAMAQQGTDTVIITGLLDDMIYYFKIWAFDSLGNFTTMLPESATTTTPSKRLNDIADATMQDTVGFGGEEYFYNYGAASNLRVGWRDALGAGSNPTYRSLIKFTDIGDIPVGATVDSAYLRLQCEQSRANDTVRVYRVLQDWHAGTAQGAYQANTVSWDSIGNGDAWNTIGAAAEVANGGAIEDVIHDRTTTEEGKSYISGTGAYSWDITSAVAHWISGDWSNYGLLLKQDTESGVDSVFNDFISGDGVGNTPYVDIYYRVLEPVVAGWNDAETLYTKQFDTSSVRIGYQLTDEEDSNAQITYEVRQKDGGWVHWNTSKNYVMGDTGWVDTSHTLNDTILWDLRAQFGASIETTCQARVIALDNKGNRDTLRSLNFVADTKDPIGLGGFTAMGAGQNSIAFSWHAVTEKNFGYYKIHFDTLALVATTDSVWDYTDDADLATRTITTTTITELLSNKLYYFTLWAVDSLGNRSTVAEINHSTTVAPILTGWGDSAVADAGQYDSSLVRIGYEVDDRDGDSVHIAVQYKIASAAGWIALTNVTGDTGSIDTSATANDTVVWDARAQLGVVDTSYLIQIIAKDNDDLYDTLVSDTFCIDTKDPVGLATFRPTIQDTNSITLQWTAPAETRFGWYQIRYDTVANITLNDTVWDSTDDATLHTRSTATTTITGLAGKQTYYFKIWAYDSLGNVAATQETSYATKNIAPQLTGWGGGLLADAIQFNTDTVRIGFEADDYDDDVITVIVEGKKPADTAWTAWSTLHTTMGGDTGLVVTSATENDTILWDMLQHIGQAIDSFYIIRIIAADTAGSGDTLYTDTFVVDTKAPVGLDSLIGIDSTFTTVSLEWDTVMVGNNFDHYEVWYDTLLNNVLSRSGSAQEWDTDNDPWLTNRGADSTVIFGLIMDHKYYFKIWGIDMFGRESTAVAAVDSVTTLPSLIPVLEGCEGDEMLTVHQVDTNRVCIGYQVDDYDDTQSTVTLEAKKVGGAWMDWDSLNAYTLGDTGLVHVSATENDTITWNVYSLMGGGIDTLYIVRLIARDATHADTLLSDTFSVDTKDPAGGLTAVASGGADTNTVTITWDKITVEPRFRYYEVRYDTLAGITLSDAVWDTVQDVTLKNIHTTSTTMTGLRSKHHYYFRVWAVDSLGNRFGSNESNTTTSNIPPVITGWSDAGLATVVQIDSSLVQIGYELNDADDVSDSVTFEIMHVGGSWIQWDSVDAYAASDTGVVSTSVAAHDTILFDVRAVWGDQVDTIYLVRVIAQDTSGQADTVVSDTFVIDTKDPVGLANFAITDTQANQFTVVWDTVTGETNFGHYEIWFDTVKTTVLSRSGALEWDNTNDGNLSAVGTATTTITDLLSAQKYFVQLWAIDAYGNGITLALDSVSTNITNYTLISDVIDAYMQTTVGFGGIEDSMNYGGAGNLRVGWMDAVGFGDNPTYRAIIRFGDIDTIPNDAIIDSAELYLYCNQNTYDDTVRLFRTLKNWTEGNVSGSQQNGSVCWNSAQYRSLDWNTGGAGATVVNAGALDNNIYDRTLTEEAKAYINAPGWIAWNVTNAVQRWVNSDWLNYGFVMKQDNESGVDSVFNDFNSGEAGSNQPYIKVWYSSLAKEQVAWWEDGGRWKKRIDLDFRNDFLGSSLAEFPVLVKLHSGRISYSDLKGDGSDLRFVDANNSTALDYHIETWDPAGTSYVWVNVPVVASSGIQDSIWMYFGNPDADDVQDTAGTYNSTIVADWHLNEIMTDEQSVGVHLDATHYNHHGTQGNNDDGDGLIGLGQYFDGVSDSIIIGDYDELSFGDGTQDNALSISAWVKMADASNFRIISKRDGATNLEYGIWTSGTDQLYVLFWDGTAVDRISRYYNTPLTVYENTWIHIGMTYDGSGNESGIKLYLNGVRVDDQSNSGGVYTAMSNTSARLSLGNIIGASSYTSGALDEMRIARVENSSHWVMAEYRSGIDSLFDWTSVVIDSHDNIPPDNDMTLTASVIANTDKIALSWDAASIDSIDADSVGIWYSSTAYPSGAFDTSAVLLGMYSKTVTQDTLSGIFAGSTYYFCLTLRDTGGVWADTVGTACDTAYTVPGTLNISGISLSPSGASAGSSNVDMLQLIFVAELETIYVDSITINLEGIGIDTGDVDTVALFSDNGGSADTMIGGAYAWFDSSGSKAWALIPAGGLVVPQGETLKIHVVLDISNDAAETDIARVALLSPDSVFARGKLSIGAVQKTGTFPLKSGDVTLPVSLTGFTAQQIKSNIFLSWQTASETDNLGYYVYRSDQKEGVYTKLNSDMIDGALNSERAHAYSYTDATVTEAGTYWYKMADIDISGRCTYHEGVSVHYQMIACTEIAPELKLQGNPLSTNSLLYVKVALEGVTSACVYNDKGEMVALLPLRNTTPGSFSRVTGRTLMHAVNYHTGIYIIELRSGTRVERIRILYLN